MPEDEVINRITNREMTFARLVLSATMTDRDAAKAAGLNPDAADYTKATPRVRAYMLEHRAPVQQRLVEPEPEESQPRKIGREEVVDYLWDIAHLGSQMTRGSITGQVKAISLIVAIQELIPDRRAASASPQRADGNQPSPAPNPSSIYVAKWLREQREKANQPQPTPEKSEKESETGVAEPPTAPASADAPPLPVPAFGSGASPFANSVSRAETPPWVPAASTLASEPDSRDPFSRHKNRNGRRR